MQDVRNMDDIPRTRWLVHLPPVVLLAGIGAWLELNLDKLPARYPIHYNLYGQADAWVPRHPASVVMPLLIGFALVAFFAMLERQLPAAMRRELARAPRGAATRLAPQRTQRILIGSEYFLALVFGAVALAPLLGPHVIGVTVFAGLAALLVTVVTLSQRMKREDAGSRDAAHWKAGLFYVNPADPALWVPKRFGLGYTLNFAHAKSWWILGLLIVFPIALAVVVIALGSRA